MNRLLLDDPPLVLQPALAVAVGLAEALVLQQLHYWCTVNARAGRTDEQGHAWVYNTIDQWCEQFPFWSATTVRRTLGSLREAGLVIAEQRSSDARDRTLSYRINHDALKAVTDSIVETNKPPVQNDHMPSVQNEQMQALQNEQMYMKESETTAETTPESARAPASNGAPTQPAALEEDIDKRIRAALGPLQAAMMTEDPRRKTSWPKLSAGQKAAAFTAAQATARTDGVRFTTALRAALDDAAGLTARAARDVPAGPPTPDASRKRLDTERAATAAYEAAYDAALRDGEDEAEADRLASAAHRRALARLSRPTA